MLLLHQASRKARGLQDLWRTEARKAKKAQVKINKPGMACLARRLL